jgi:ankyrin repeat protein
MQSLTDDFLKAATIPLDSSHASGKLDAANAILVTHAELPATNIFTAAVTGNADAIKSFIASDPSLVSLKGGPHNWDALTYLCFSLYLQWDPSRSEDFVEAATILLKAGADANSGFWEQEHQPLPEWEPVLYGAAGIAHHPGVTRLLLDHGADPNAGEVVYHSPETDDNETIKLLLATGKITEENRLLMLIRKHDWHDYDGIKLLLETGLDPNTQREAGKTAMLHGILRDNDASIIELLLQYGANPAQRYEDISPFTLAARRGRGDLLALFEKYGFTWEFKGVEKLIAACARNDDQTIASIKINESELVDELLLQGAKLLGEFAGTANADGVRHLLDLGVPITALYDGDGYYGIPPKSMALHIACWRAWHNVVRLLIDRGAPLNVMDGTNHTPLQLAIRACVNSYWTYRRKTSSIEALLDAGAYAGDIMLLTGYPEADKLIMKYVP